MNNLTYSPDGNYLVTFDSFEAKMSHWIDCPKVIFAPYNETILDLSESLWSADQVTWDEDGVHVSLVLRRYPGDVPGVTLALDLYERSVHIVTPYEEAQVYPDQALKWLEKYYLKYQPNINSPQP